MKSIKFLREPGYIYDLIFIFIYYFNRDYCLSNLINNDKSDDDINFYNGAMYEFSNISNELYLFFYLKGNGKCFFSTYYHEPFKNQFVSEYNLTYIQRLLLDYNNIIKSMLQYYFPDISESEIDFYFNSILNIAKKIDDSDYNDTIKSKLYSFFINPLPIIETLNYSLLTVNASLSKYYERNIQIIIDIQNQINIDNLTEELRKDKKHDYSLDSFENIYFSICLIHKNCIKAFCNNNATILLGYDYKDALSFLQSQQTPIALDEIANVLSEKNRTRILDVILEKGEISIRDLEKELEISGPNAYYHITMMVNANMIKSRNEGKVVLYSLNKNHFGSIIENLKKYL